VLLSGTQYVPGVHADSWHIPAAGTGVRSTCVPVLRVACLSGSTYLACMLTGVLLNLHSALPA